MIYERSQTVQGTSAEQQPPHPRHRLHLQVVAYECHPCALTPHAYLQLTLAGDLSVPKQYIQPNTRRCMDRRCADVQGLYESAKGKS